MLGGYPSVRQFSAQNWGIPVISVTCTDEVVLLADCVADDLCWNGSRKALVGD